MDTHLEITKLAKLVGVEDWTELGTPMVPSYDGCKWEHYRQWNPRKSADDDYAVLEWARNQNKEFFSDFCDALFEAHSELFRDWKSHQRCHAWNYSLGDNARAALKVIDRALSEVRTEDAA